ncbi:MAG: hypothetical protein FWC16_13495 [Defluviitaleaceae bacterium]|nr:hypothetical protein [Defluviitaleaceae bacterium]MCL2275935.1 hypothetical protein [Defluviitaleaceae bacterium]
MRHKNTKIHVATLIFRIALLAYVLLLRFPIIDRFTYGEAFLWLLALNYDFFLWVVWAYLIFEMLFRLFPNKMIAIGARKHFSVSYNAAPEATQNNDLRRDLHKGTALVFFSWLFITIGVLFWLHITGWLTPLTVIILMLGYAVMDIVFILFFCPFKAWFMKNRCCTTCRIYNWDYLMMCAPLLAFPSFYTLSLFLMSLAVFLQWEISAYKNPHFFSHKTNANLRCDTCDDGLCRLRSEA